MLAVAGPDNILAIPFAALIGGAGMSTPEITMLSAIFEKKLVLLFVGLIFTAAVITGCLLQVISL